jgi:putative DNA primase/helicase
MSIPPTPPNVNGAYGPLPRLTPRHLADLRKSGLTDETIARCGFYSLRRPIDIQKILRWEGRYNGALGECLAIPFFDAEGKPTGHVRLKPDRLRKAKDGKPIKYESPKGISNRAYIPPGPVTLAALKDPLTPLLITEGEKKAAKADQEGFPCIGLTGVWNWQKKRIKKDGEPQGERELIDDLAAIPWAGRTVFLVFDSDPATKTNRNVRHAERCLAEALFSKGAIVKAVRLPTDWRDNDGKPKKVGLDDFLFLRKTDEPDLHELMAAAVAPLGVTPNEAPDDPHRLARLFIDKYCRHAGKVTLRFWRDEWYRWDGSAYRIVPERELRAELTTLTKAEMDLANLDAQKKHADQDKDPPTVKKVTGRMIADVAHALASLTILPSGTEAPAWIDGDGPFPAAEILACRNWLIHLPSFVARKTYFARPTPQFFSTNCLDFDFKLKAPAPTAWLAFLADLWPDDPQSIGALQDWFGYLLTPDTRQQKILLLVGPKRSGKGTIARVIRGLIGADNIAGPTLSSLGTNFGLWPLLGKSVAMIQDARLSGRTDAAAVVERLLSLSGEDALTIDRKYLPPVTAKMHARFMLLTNELPKLSDSSGALAGRMILLRLKQSWYGKEDTGLTDRLLAELPGILLWAIKGWQRLRKRGHFLQPDDGKGLIDDLADLASPVGAFVRDCCEIAPALQVERKILHDAYKRWCEEQGQRPDDPATFGRNLHAAVSSVGDAQPRDGNGERFREYTGICLKGVFLSV